MEEAANDTAYTRPTVSNRFIYDGLAEPYTIQ